MTEALVNKRDAAKLLGVTVRSVENFVASGKLPLVKLGRRALFDPADLRRFVDAMKVTRNAEGGAT
jgi:excisionase family DNA binding protein